MFEQEKGLKLSGFLLETYGTEEDAELLGLKPSTLQSKMKKLGIVRK